MNTMEEMTDRQARSLLLLVEEQREAQCRALLEQTGREAAVILHAAHQEARGRLRQAVKEERSRMEHAMHSARAKQESVMQSQRLTSFSALLARGRELLVQELQNRWQQPEKRALWIRSLARTMPRIRSDQPWEIFHPLDWETAEWHKLALVAEPGEPLFFSTEKIVAGLRLCRGGTCLDGTIQGFLERGELVDAHLLTCLSRSISGEPVSLPLT